MVHRGLIVGRFQPPHLGHLEVIKFALEQVDELIIVIAAAQLSHTAKNPLTAGERSEMMRIMLSNNDVDAKKYWIIPAQDILDNALWVSHLKRLVPKFDVFFGNNPFTDLLFSEHGITTMNTPMFKRELFEASKIRELLIKKRSVKKYLDGDVIRLLKEFNIYERLKGIHNSDSPNSKNSKKPGSELQDL